MKTFLNKLNKFKKSMFIIIPLISFLLLLPIALPVYSQEDFRDPFKTILPNKKIEPTPTQQQDNIQPPSLSIEGILWGSEVPMAIINGEVYKVGDILIDSGAKIYKIEKNVVVIVYKGKVFNMFMKKKSQSAPVPAQNPSMMQGATPVPNQGKTQEPAAPLNPVKGESSSISVKK